MRKDKVMDVIENGEMPLADVQRIYQRELANQAFVSAQIVGTAESGSSTYEELQAKLSRSRKEVARLARQITGDPMQGVMSTPVGAKLIPK